MIQITWTHFKTYVKHLKNWSEYTDQIRLIQTLDTVTTRMHCSRMSTVRFNSNLSVERGDMTRDVCPGGVCLEASAQGGGSALGGGASAWRCLFRGVCPGGSVQGVSAQGCLLVSVCPGGVCLEGFCLVGVSAKECVHVHGGVHPLYPETDTP